MAKSTVLFLWRVIYRACAPRRGSKLARRALLALIASVGIWAFVAQSADAGTVVFYSDFESGIPAEFSGWLDRQATTTFRDVSAAGHSFGDYYLQNQTGDMWAGGAGNGPPALKTNLTLTGLPAHDSVDLTFLLAIIRTWDGNNPFSGAGPDYFNVDADGVSIFHETFEIYNTTWPHTQSYVAPPGTSTLVPWPPDPCGTAYYMSLSGIPHSSSTLTLDFYASGAGWQGGNDEWWAIDTVAVSVGSAAVPLPSAFLGGISLLTLLPVFRRVRALRQRSSTGQPLPAGAEKLVSISSQLRCALAALIAGVTIIAAAPAFGGSVNLTISGSVDGSGVMQVNANSVSWTNLYWSTPTALTVNGTAWNPAVQPSLSLSSPLLPDGLADYVVSTSVLSGRDVANAQIVGDHVLVYFADTPNGADNYQLQLLFSPKPPVVASLAASLRITGNIDVSDLLRITNSGATWIHRFWGQPSTVSINGEAWDTVANPTLPNSGATAFLPAGLDLSTVVFTKNSGRDTATYQLFSDHIDVYFADNPIGASNYDVTLSFGSAVPLPSAAWAGLALMGIAFAFRMLRSSRWAIQIKGRPVMRRLSCVCFILLAGLLCAGYSVAAEPAKKSQAAKPKSLQQVMDLLPKSLRPAPGEEWTKPKMATAQQWYLKNCKNILVEDSAPLRNVANIHGKTTKVCQFYRDGNPVLKLITEVEGDKVPEMGTQAHFKGSVSDIGMTKAWDGKDDFWVGLRPIELTFEK